MRGAVMYDAGDVRVEERHRSKVVRGFEGPHRLVARVCGNVP